MNGKQESGITKGITGDGLRGEACSWLYSIHHVIIILVPFYSPNTITREHDIPVAARPRGIGVYLAAYTPFQNQMLGQF